MRLEATNRSDQYKFWLSDDELEELRRAAQSHRDDILIQLGGYVGLRAFEILQVTPGHVKRTAEGDHFRLRVPEGKIPAVVTESLATRISRQMSRVQITGSQTQRESARMSH